jgi:hypothetical protein
VEGGHPGPYPESRRQLARPDRRGQVIRIR